MTARFLRVITTKRPKEIEVDNSSDANTIQVFVMGFYKGREFYSPKYEATDTSNIGGNKRRLVVQRDEAGRSSHD